MTDLELDIIDELEKIEFKPRSGDKMFVRQLSSLAKNNPDVDLPEKTKGYLAVVAWRYRKHLPENLHFRVACMRSLFGPKLLATSAATTKKQVRA